MDSRVILEVFNSTNPIDDSRRALSQQFKILLRSFWSREYVVTMDEINAKHLECYCYHVWLLQFIKFSSVL